jgi:hypothetical protein
VNFSSLPLWVSQLFIVFYIYFYLKVLANSCFVSVIFITLFFVVFYHQANPFHNHTDSGALSIDIFQVQN